MASLAVFVSSHGFGHAARVCAVVDRLQRRRPDLEVHFVTAVPRWFLEASLDGPFSHDPSDVDPGLVQPSALEIDLEATARRLARMVPYDVTWVDRLARDLDRRDCRLVVCDIAPVGLAVAARISRPGVLLENFTWDWIYRGLDHAPSRLLEVAETLELVFGRADLRLRAEPACGSADGLSIPPVRRSIRSARQEVRDALGIDGEAPLVLLSMGGIGWRFDGLDRLLRHPRMVFVVPGSAESPRRDGALLRLPHRCGIGHPDLMAAADVVVGKLGYSTVAEAVGGRTRIAYVPRPGFPESVVLAKYVDRTLPSVAVSRESFDSGAWVEAAEELVSRPRPRSTPGNGADVAADIILERFDL